MAATVSLCARPAPDPGSWRKAIGRRLREAREDAGLRLIDVARSARVSPQYLSEVERGRKEASSEVLQAVTGALGMTLVELAGGVARDLARALGGPASAPTSSVRPSLELTSSPASSLVDPTAGGLSRPRATGHGVTLLAA